MTAACPLYAPLASDEVQPSQAALSGRCRALTQALRGTSRPDDRALLAAWLRDARAHLSAAGGAR